MELNTIYSNPTKKKFLKIVKSLNLKGYDLIRTKENFFIWKKKNKEEFIRLILKKTGWNEKTLFYWNLELSFKPFNYKHNHREKVNIQSEYFNSKAEDLFYDRFLDMIKKIKDYFKTDRLKGGLKGNDN